MLNLPVIHTDQTVESIISSVRLANAIPTNKPLTQELFGSASIDIRRPFFKGISSFIASGAGKPYPSVEAFVSQHCLIALCFPFTEEHTSARVIEKLRTNNLGGIALSLSLMSQDMFRKERRYCPQCAKDEISEYGYGYAHRTHQVLGVRYCAEHGLPLQTIDRLNGFVEDNGIITTTHTLPLRESSNDFPLPHSSIHRFSSWVKSVFDDTFPRLSPHQRLKAIKIKLHQYFEGRKKPSTFHAQLKTVLTENYPEDFMEEIGLSLGDSDTAYWPYLFGTGIAYRLNAMSNLIIFNVLFETPEQLQKEILKYDIPVSSQNHPRYGVQPPKLKLGFGFFKLLLSEPNHHEIAKKLGIHIETLRHFLSFDPDLTQRRLRAQQYLRIKRHKKVLSQFLLNNPGDSIAKLRRDHESSYIAIKRHDSTWLHKNVLSYCANTPDALLYSSHIDTFYVHLLQEHIEKLHNTPTTTQITHKYLYRIISSYRPHNSMESFPLCDKFISRSSEDMETYLDRITLSIQRLVNNGQLDVAINIAYTLTQQFPKNKNIFDLTIKSFITKTYNVNNSHISYNIINNFTESIQSVSH